ncbi:MAG: DUF429 domain-containing protein [Candidatus Omnitrophica bacterium]|nr:DUF429 domain-containing protein [Candidatus Omnitrophota bacterium]
MQFIGLDWIGKKYGWAFCKIRSEPSDVEIDFGTLAVENHRESELLQRANKIVIDVPIGLPQKDELGCECRSCDYGVKKWLGPHYQSSVFPPPTSHELVEWRRRKQSGEKQLQGHFRGLLPAIDSGERIKEAFPEKVIESHPELVFTALAGSPLPKCAKKITLLGLHLRLSLLASAGNEINLESLAISEAIPTDNFIDAAAMALVAISWGMNHRCKVIRDGDGLLQDHGDTADDSTLMALPFEIPSDRKSLEISVRETLQLALQWDPNSRLPIS